MNDGMVEWDVGHLVVWPEAGRQQCQKLKEVSNIRDAALGTMGES